MAASDESARSAGSSDLYDSTSEIEKEPGEEIHITENVKRKAEDSSSPPQKKRRLSQGTSRPESTPVPFCVNLPPDIWQNVFSYLHPQDLGRLLQVNRVFNLYLTRIRDLSGKAYLTFPKLQTSEAVWSNSRKSYESHFPKPLIGTTELDMWKLVKGRRCQFCHKIGQPQGNSTWDRGPGRTGVRIVWAFGIRSCGMCLESKCQKDTSLLMSTASPLLPGLPFIFLTQDLHVVPASTLHHASPPPTIQLRKCYYTTQVEQIQEEFIAAKALGQAAAEEWHKGLDSRGKTRLSDAERCERWEINHVQAPNTNNKVGAAAKADAPANIATLPVSTNPDPRLWHTSAPNSQHPIYSPAPTGFAGPFNAPIPIYNGPNPYAYGTHSMQHPMPQSQPPYIPNSYTPTYQQTPYAPPPLPTHPAQRHDRSFRDVTEMKALRRADIERRCEALHPPIAPNILRHMDSFKAAMQITTPMTDRGWEMLKPKLIAQREIAEEKERQDAAHKSLVQHKVSDRRQQEISQRELKEITDREWEEAQKPLRTQLGRFADEILKQWDFGSKVTRETAPQFAANVILHVRNRFVEESEEPHTASETESNDTNLSRRKLILENMKWVFDHKVKHITDKFRKELFLCNGCEGNYKHYGFEGVIQHYAAKHTSTLSVGNVVVAWKEAEWPEESPFIPDPSAAKVSQQFVSNFPAASRGASITPQMFAHMPRPLSQASPMSGYGQNGMYGPFQPPPGQPIIPGYRYDTHTMQQMSLGVGPSGQYYPGSPPMQQGPSPFHGSTRPPDQLTYSPSQVNDNGILTSNASNRSSSPQAQPPQSVQNVPAKTPGSPQVHAVVENISDEQVSVFARTFIDVWSTLSGVGDLPNSVRLYVTINVASLSFQKRNGHWPSIDLFVEALERNPLLTPHKHSGGLQCKSCPDVNVARTNPRGFPIFDDSIGFNVLSLAYHYKHEHYRSRSSDHGSEGASSQPDWIMNFVFLPRENFIVDLAQAEGMDDTKIKLIREVFPKLFTMDQPKVSTSAPGEPSARQTMTVSTVEDDNMAQRRPVRLIAPASGGSGEDYSPQSGSPQFGPDEYDPRRPAMDQNARSYVRSHARRRPYMVPGEEDFREPVYYVPRGSYEDEYTSRRGYYTEEDPWIPVRTGSAGRRVRQDRQYAPRDHERSHSPKPIAEPVPDRRLPSGQSYIRPNVLDMDETAAAELAKETAANKGPTSPEGAEGPEGEADRFLNDLLNSRDDLELYKSQAEERDQAREEALRAQWETERRPEEPENSFSPREARIYRDGLPATHTGASTASSHVRGRRSEDFHTGGRGRSPDLRGEYRPRPPAYRRRERYVEPVPASRYARYMRVYREREEPGPPARPPRPQSRYERYEATRRQIERSQSPSRRVSEMPESFREHSINPDRSTQVSPHEPTPMFEDNYSPAPPLRRYRYAEPAPTTYLDEYGRRVQMIPVHEPHYAPRNHRYVSDSRYEYLPYERGHRQEHIYYEPAPVPVPGYGYPPERRPFVPPERDGMSYEPELQVKPEPAATPASFVEHP
ncbi:hypothetical protein EJ05DRAFT_504260 [Pseudovirgaria hyperparasitica]|uniref:F-box domain-containing protein n=1 Tax=Pseudovirgaria hyperparasitica TaxID=470096 RepID=A0A6A6VWX9_9PEZI|nr:uncharacterized protein EJ05DRAFT_504260 [Pseudovirgaria hyperparasitica]KAF2754150.1 hypothetical protein EJ05DRAFT_504260 [Pseudovirgaria hyperparasitica]